MGSRFKGWSADELHDDYRAGKSEAVHLLLRGSSKRGAVRARYVASPRQDTNIVGVGIGRRYAEGKGSSEHAVRVYVRRKLPKSQVGKHKIPDHFDGIRTDVIETGAFRALGKGIKAAQARTRPLRSGLSIGFASTEDFVVGTIGAIVMRGADRFVLGNNHVLAFENSLPPGTAILQPSRLDNGQNGTDRVGALAEFVRLEPFGNQMDAAIARIAPQIAVTAGFAHGPRLASGLPLPAVTEMRITKLGRTTGRTDGRIDDISVDVAVDFETGQFVFEDQLMLRASSAPFSDDGDSGALVVATAQKRPVGLLFAGSASHALATPIDRVLAGFGVTILA